MKNFLKVIVIILSLSVTFIIGISQVNAEEHDFSKWKDVSQFHLPNNISADDNYIVIWKRGGNAPGGYKMVYFPKTYTRAQVATDVDLSGLFPYAYGLKFYNGTNWFELDYYQTDSDNDYYFPNNSGGRYATYNVGAGGYVVYSNINIHLGDAIHNYGIWFDTEWLNSPFDVSFEQGEVIIKNSGGSIANLVTYYIEPTFDDFVPEDYIFSYIENTTGGGFRDSHQFYLTYIENGIVYNGKSYHYYFNLPLSYNTGLTFSISDLSNTLIQENQFTAYLSSLTDLSGYTMYDFSNYEFADMSDINTGLFGLSYQLNTNITINAINYNTNAKIDFLNSSYLINSNTDNNGVTWYEFNFNNEPIYLEFINNFNDISDFYTYIDTYNLYLYFDNNSYVHLSGSPNSIDSQDNIVNQSAYKDSQGNIVYNNNPIIISIDNSNEFFQNFQRYFKDFDNDTFGLTGIITSPLNLIQNLLSNTCNSLVVPIPYINSNLTLPCMSSIYSQYFGGFYIIYQDITFGFVAYWVIVRILNMVKDFRNPDHDEIEVLDL